MAEIKAFEPRREELRQIADSAYELLTDEQRKLFAEVHKYVRRSTEEPNHPVNCPLFIEGTPGRGMSFVTKATSASLRSDSLIVLIVGTTALAVQQYERGQTALNMFHLPVNEANRRS